MGVVEGGSVFLGVGGGVSGSVLKSMVGVGAEEGARC